MVDRTSLDYRAERSIQASANFRVIFVSVLSAVIGILAGFIAFILYNLIGFFTNLFFVQRLSFDLVSPKDNRLNGEEEKREGTTMPNGPRCGSSHVIKNGHIHNVEAQICLQRLWAAIRREPDVAAKFCGNEGADR